MMVYWVQGVTVGFVYWVSLSLDVTLRLNLIMEEYAVFLGDIDEEGLPNESTLLVKN